MSNERSYTNEPPGWPPADWPPAPGREYYLPEDYYFYGPGRVSVGEAARVTAQCVAQWTDRYEAFTVGSRTYRKKGPLPEDTKSREALIDKVFTDLGSLPELEFYHCAVNLYLEDVQVLAQGDGIPGILELKPDEFGQLQEEWERHGLPRDLYYLASAQFAVVEPVENYSGVFLAKQRYSPVRWAHRDETKINALQIPSEHERVERFVEECVRFVQAIQLRKQELQEPGREPDDEEVKRLGRLQSEIMAAAGHARGRPLTWRPRLE